MRKIFLGLLFATLLWAPCAHGGKIPDPLPLFMDPDFRFSQIDSICLPPILDVRADKSSPLYLTERVGIADFGHLPPTDKTLNAYLISIGYPTVQCNAVTAAASDLAAPSEAWMRTLDFGQSRWLFIYAVEDARVGANWLGGEGGYAVVSGLLFEKRTSGVKLVWRERAAGVPWENMFGRKEKVLEAETAESVNNTIVELLAKFEWRAKKRRQLAFAVDEQEFPANCEAAWTAVKDFLSEHQKKYVVFSLDDSDRLALYARGIGGRPMDPMNEDHLALKPKGNACVMEVTQSFPLKRSDDWDELAKQVRASLPRQ